MLDQTRHELISRAHAYVMLGWLQANSGLQLKQS